MKNELTAERLRELLRYEPETGVFTRLKSVSPATKIGDVAGHLNRMGYWVIAIDGTAYRGHRLAWLYVTGGWPSDQVDHIDRNRCNNRIANLREATNADNQQNSVWRRDNSSGYRGVSWHKGRCAWVARITVGGKPRSLGYFQNPEDAGLAYRVAKAEMHKFRPVDSGATA